MFPRRRIITAVAIGLASVSFAQCSSGEHSSVAPSSTSTTTAPRPGADGALAIGQLAPLTGPIATISDSFTVPVRLAVDEMNLSGGVNGKPVGLVVGDDASALDTGKSAFSTLVDANHVDAIIGPSTSQLALALIAANERDPVVICSGSNSYGPISRAAPTSGFYFRTAPPDQLQADALARLIVADGHRRPVVLATGDAYGVPFGTALVRDLRAQHVPGARFVTIKPGGADGVSAVDRALTRNPDAVVLIGFPEGTAPVLKALVARGKGPNQIPTYGSDGLQSADLGALVDPANPAVVAGMKGTSPAGAPAGIDHPFNARLLTAGVEPFFSASTYDCTILVGLAAVAARSDDPRKIRNHFAANLGGKLDCSTFAECASALKSRRTIHYRGASSVFNRWQRFEPGTGVYDIWTLGLDARPVLAPATSQLAVP